MWDLKTDTFSIYEKFTSFQSQLCENKGQETENCVDHSPIKQGIWVCILKEEACKHERAMLVLSFSPVRETNTIRVD